MPKIDIVICIVQAAMTYDNNPKINAIFALIAHNRNQLQNICESQDDNGDIMAESAVLYAIGMGQRPSWMAQAGL